MRRNVTPAEGLLAWDPGLIPVPPEIQDSPVSGDAGLVVVVEERQAIGVSDQAEAAQESFVDATVAAEEAVPAEVIAASEVKKPSWLRRHGIKAALGATALSGVAEVVAKVVSNPITETISTAEHTIPWLGGTMGGLELVWCLGAAAMMKGVGKAIPWKGVWGESWRDHLRVLPRAYGQVRGSMDGMAAEANESDLFRAGLVANTTAAVAQFVVPTVAVCAEMPPETWGVLGLPALDFLATVAIRGAIVRGMHDNATPRDI